jgi:hypothetical protein
MKIICCTTDAACYCAFNVIIVEMLCVILLFLFFFSGVRISAFSFQTQLSIIRYPSLEIKEDIHIFYRLGHLIWLMKTPHPPTADANGTYDKNGTRIF